MFVRRNIHTKASAFYHQHWHSNRCICSWDSHREANNDMALLFSKDVTTACLSALFTRWLEWITNNGEYRDFHLLSNRKLYSFLSWFIQLSLSPFCVKICKFWIKMMGLVRQTMYFFSSLKKVELFWWLLERNLKNLNRSSCIRTQSKRKWIYNYNSNYCKQFVECTCRVNLSVTRQHFAILLIGPESHTQYKILTC